MKKVLLLVCFSIIFCSAFSQSTFDKSLNEVSADMAGKLSQKSKKKIVVLYVTDINKAQTVAGKYMADVISVNIVNDQGNFEVFDRENLSGIVEAKKLMAEGYIDANKAKELGRILAVDAIVIGNYTVLTTTLKLTLKALDVNSGFVIAATMKDLPINADVAALLGINIGSEGNNNTSNRGFNGQPISSNEIYNNETTVSSDCQKYGYGNYCFTNRLPNKVEVHLKQGTKKALKKLDSDNKPMFYEPEPYRIIQIELTLEPNQTQCIYELKSGSCSYEIILGSRRILQGEIYVEQCKSKTFVIK